MQNDGKTRMSIVKANVANQFDMFKAKTSMNIEQG